MRIAFLTTHPIQYQVPLFRALHRRSDVEFTALFCHDRGLKPTYDIEFGREVQYDVPLLGGYHCRFLKAARWRLLSQSVDPINPEIFQILSGDEYDAVIVHGYATLTCAASYFVPRRSTRLIMRSESHLRSGTPPTLKRIAKKAFLRTLFSRIDHFLAIGSWNREYYEAQGVSREKITLAPYSVDNQFFSERAAATRTDLGEARRRLGLPQRHVLFLFVGKFIPKKCPFELLEAFVRADISDRAGLAYVGEGELRGELESRVASLAPDTAVAILGFRNQTELPELFSACDVLVLPSSFEPWGLVVNEALACGAAVIVSDQVGAGPDLVADSRCTYPTGDVGELARILRRVVDDSGFLEELKANGRQRIAQWGIEQTADGVVHGVTSALEARSNRR